MPKLTQNTVADHLCMTRQNVADLERRGVIDRDAGLDACRENYIRHLREMAAGRAGANGELDLVQERARHSKEQADKLQMENAVRRGELMDANDVATMWEKIATSARAKLFAIPSKAAPLLVDKPIAEIKDILERHVHECAAAIANDPMGDTCR